MKRQKGKVEFLQKKMMEAIKYIRDNKMEKEVNELANKVGDIYMASIMLYRKIPQTDSIIEICKEIVKRKKEQNKNNLDALINGVR